MDDTLFNPFPDDPILSPLSSPVATTSEETAENKTPSFEEITPPNDVPEATEQSLSPADVARLKQSLMTLRTQVDAILDLLKGQALLPLPHASFAISEAPDVFADQKSLEGIFDGEKMIGDDAGIYTIPPNYASKSKLVEGDRLKLTITPNGSFIYKQVKPIPRKRVIGELVLDQDQNQWGVFFEGHLYKVLKASVTFYKGNIGDDAVILIPEQTACTWGAIENIIHK